MKRTALLLIVVIAAIAALALLRPAPPPQHEPIRGLPWQIAVHDDGTSTVFGLTLDHSTLADALQKLGPDMELAVLAAPGEPGTLEAYYDRATAGVLTGRMVLVATADPAALAAWRGHPVKIEHTASGARKYILDQNDRNAALAAPITAITFIPAVSLDEAVARKRFGPPAERLPAGPDAEHLLYPAKGLDLLLNRHGKDVLQYVAPRDFARLRQPLTSSPDQRPPSRPPTTN